MAKSAYKIKTHMGDKEQIIKAIGNYATYSIGYRKILKLLVELAIDNIAHITVIQLSRISMMSREMIYHALSVFQQDGLIKIIKRTNGKTATINCIVLNPNKFDQIRHFYIKQLEIQKKYEKE